MTVTFLVVVVQTGADSFLFMLVRVPKGKTIGEILDSVGVAGQERNEGVEVLVVDTLFSAQEVLCKKLG